MSGNEKASATASGIGFFGLLTIVFIVLKLIGVINWSWFWVLFPFFVPVLFVILFFVVVYWIIGRD